MKEIVSFFCICYGENINICSSCIFIFECEALDVQLQYFRVSISPDFLSSAEMPEVRNIKEHLCCLQQC